MILFMLRKTIDIFALAKQKIWKFGDETVGAVYSWERPFPSFTVV